MDTLESLILFINEPKITKFSFDFQKLVQIQLENKNCFDLMIEF